MTKALTQKRHVNLADYELTTTLGTGKPTECLNVSRFIRQSASCKKQEERRVLRDEATQESRYNQTASSRPRDL